MSCEKCKRVFETVNWKHIEFSQENAADQVPKSSGVYAIVVRKPGLQIGTIMKRLSPFFEHCNNIWPEGRQFLKRKLCPLGRIVKHPDCVILYVGRSGTSSDRTLHHRFKELSGGHTIWPALWSLLYHGWKLEFRWHSSGDPKQTECNLIQQFCREHNGSPEKPALNTDRPPNCPRDGLP